MFYGDETLKALIEHSKKIEGIINEFEDIHSLTELQDEYLDEDDLSLSLEGEQLYEYERTEEEEADASSERKSKGRLYFTQLHEDAIVEYAKEDTSIQKRQELYTKFIGPTFNEMVDKIVFTYKFTSLPNVDDLKSECKVF